ncbi:MAG: hypothetical protein JEZ04_15020 [Spirochaetales bacterium]|nr:hypothetical protein [Spirochaetales bacterium]
MKNHRKNKNGIQKTTPVFLWISALFRPEIRAGLGKTLSAIFIKFFFYQFQTVLFPKTRPVVNIDHPLDENIPFDPSWVGLYNTFTVFWMKSAGWLLKTFGPEAASDVAAFTRDIALMYNTAGDVYGKCQSTTNRPAVFANFNFIIIHIFDPHLHCIPSLHVMVCAYTGFMTSEIIKKHADDPEKYRAELDWVHKNALEIIESVLLVKQHSVNCIPAGYFMMSMLFDNFRTAWASRYMDEMFQDDPKGISEVPIIVEYIKNLYTRFMNDYKINGDQTQVLLDFLKEYENGKKKIKKST